ncbi:hypothetical protein ANCDUO_10471 [Ancylostoma duodenale]|uniref:Uncharacterized protein n=1 Tax=Ancylostoma duodenale TaxID=51022 RepID=A0A0C2DAE5_9BILA|nr:hypothetical protein ANCDUO_10471 [Ancylostoma duodenale]
MGDSDESGLENHEQEVEVAEGVDESSDEEAEEQVEDEERADHIGVDSKRFAIPSSDEDLMYETVYKFVVKNDISLEEARRAIRAFNTFKPDLVNTVCHVASVGDHLPENMKDTCADRIEIMEMLVYLIKNLVLRLEGIAVKRSYQESGVQVANDDDSDLDEDVIVDENMSDEGFETWSKVRNQVLEMIDFICCLNISRGNGEVIENAIQFLSRPPRLDPELLRCFSTIILKFASHPRFSKKNAKEDLVKLLTHMRPICIGFDFANSFAEELVDATMKFDYLKDARSEYPFVDLVEKFSEPGSSVYNSYTIMTDCLLDFLEDTNPQVRLNVLNFWVHIANSRRVPFDSLKKGIFNAITERLKTEKSANARKLAMQFLVLYLLLGPYGKELNFDALSKACGNLANFMQRIEAIDPGLLCFGYHLWRVHACKTYTSALERPGVQVIMERFNSFVDKMRKELTNVIETKKYDENSDDLVDEPFEKIIVMMVNMVELSMEDVVCVLAKMCFLGKFKNISPYVPLIRYGSFALVYRFLFRDLPTEQLVEELINEFRRYYITMNMGHIGDSFGQDRLEEMGAAFEENMDRAERAANVVQEKMLFAEQMTLLFPHILEALEQSGFTDINYAVTFFATCYRFKIRRGDIDIVETANCLMERLTDKDDVRPFTDRFFFLK